MAAMFSKNTTCPYLGLQKKDEIVEKMSQNLSRNQTKTILSATAIYKLKLSSQFHLPEPSRRVKVRFTAQCSRHQKQDFAARDVA